MSAAYPATSAGLCCEAPAPRQGASLCSGFLFEAEEILVQVDVAHWAREKNCRITAFGLQTKQKARLKKKASLILSRLDLTFR